MLTQEQDEWLKLALKVMGSSDNGLIEDFKRMKDQLNPTIQSAYAFDHDKALAKQMRLVKSELEKGDFVRAMEELSEAGEMADTLTKNQPSKQQVAQNGNGQGNGQEKKRFQPENSTFTHEYDSVGGDEALLKVLLERWAPAYNKLTQEILYQEQRREQDLEKIRRPRDLEEIHKKLIRRDDQIQEREEQLEELEEKLNGDEKSDEPRINLNENAKQRIRNDIEYVKSQIAERVEELKKEALVKFNEPPDEPDERIVEAIEKLKRKRDELPAKPTMELLQKFTIEQRLHLSKYPALAPKWFEGK